MIFDMLKPKARITESSELAKLLGTGSMTAAGVAINSQTAMNISAVYACITVIAETLAQLPLILYKRDGDNKSRATTHRLYRLLHDAPNSFQTSFDWRMTKTAHILLYGAGYSFISRSVSGEILELLPMHPDKMEIKQNKDFSIEYIFTDLDGKRIPLRQDQVFRVTGFSLDGVNGISPIEYHRQTMGIASAADRHTALTFKNGAKHSGILQNDGHFTSDDVAKRVKESWDEANSGDNSHKTALLEDGLEWKAVSMTNRDAQYIESRKFQIEEIARIFHMQLHKIGHLEKATNNNIEHQGLEFVTATMMPWLMRWEQSIARDLLGVTDSRSFFAEFLVDGLLRGDSTARAAFYQSAVGTPWMTVNEARAAENRNPVEGGDKLVTPLNMAGITDE